MYKRHSISLNIPILKNYLYYISVLNAILLYTNQCYPIIIDLISVNENKFINNTELFFYRDDAHQVRTVAFEKVLTERCETS